MGKKIQLSITDPCHENWDNMTQADKGRFCASCQKQVIDFTNMSDSQLAAFFKKPILISSKDGEKEASVCGRFYDDQLDRDIEIPKKRIPWVKYFFQFALPAFLISIKTSAQSKAKIRQPMVRVERIKNKDSVPVVDMSALLAKSPVNVRLSDEPSLPLARMNTEMIAVAGGISIRYASRRDQKNSSAGKRVWLEGRVIDADDEPIPFASIMIKGKNVGVSADSNGVFSFGRIALVKEIVMQVSSVGFKPLKVTIDKQTDFDNLVIRLQSANELPGVVVQTYGLVRRTVVTGGVTSCRKLTPWSVNNEEKLPLTATLYPNPVQRSGSFYIAVDNAKDELMQLSIIGMNGNIVLNRTETIRKGFNRIQVNVQPSWAAGIFVMQLLNEKGEVVKSEKLIVQ